MSWIRTINYEEADTSLKRMYDRVKGRNNKIDNVLTIHSLRPHTLVGHMTLYKAVLHNSNNSLPKWYLEMLGVYVSYLNECNYCVDHHFAGLKKLLNNDEQAKRFIESVKKGSLEMHLDQKLFQGAHYAMKLTTQLNTIQEDDIDKLKAAGFTEGEILEINQVTSYFNYVNRSVIGLGVNTKGDELGQSPNDSDDANNWNHQ